MKYTVPITASLILAAQLLSAIPRLSPTTDEFTFHVPTGLVYWKTGDFATLNPAAPPLARLISTTPAHFLGINVPLHHPSLAAFDAETFSRELYYNSGNDHLFLTLITRIPIALLSIFLLWIVWGWSTALYGRAGGALSAFLMIFCPNILAHSTLATQDLAMTLAWTAAIWGLWRYHLRIGGGRLFLAGSLLGIALLTKHTAILLFPISLIFLLMSTWRDTTPERFLPILVIGGSRWFFYLTVAFAVVWAGYGFEFKPILAGLPRVDEKIAFIRHAVDLMLGPKLGDSPLTEVIKTSLIHFAETVRLPLTSYFVSLAGVIKHSTEGHLTYLMGEFSQMGWPHYFGVAFLIKTPIPFLLLLLITMLLTLWKLAKSLFRRAQQLPPSTSDSRACTQSQNSSSPARFSGRLGSAFRLLGMTGSETLSTRPGVIFPTDLRTQRGGDLFLLIPAIVLFVSASRGHLQIGLRHILPIYPLLFIWCGAVGREGALILQKIRGKRVTEYLLGAFVVAFGLWYVVGTLRVFPHYLAYFNELIGGPKNGYHYLLDSNVEWGQGLIGLHDFVKKTHIKKIYVDYPWPPLPEKYGIPAMKVPSTSPLPTGWYAISVNDLHHYPWTKARKPTAHVGYGILIYEIEVP